jgi:hypothetical protein
MLIETTQTFDNKEDAEDNLEGIKGLPGFLYGYIRTPSASGQKYDLIHIFECNGDTQNLRKQRAIEHFTIAENTVVTTRTGLSSDQQTMLELLTYPNPEGLHPAEIRWRDFARALLAIPVAQKGSKTLANHERAGLG